MVPASFAEGLVLGEAQRGLKAANGSDISVLGTVTLSMRLGEMNVPLHCVVVDNVSEVLLGFDWLSEHVESWDLRREEIRVNGGTFPLCGPPRVCRTRRVKVARATTVPARSEVNLVARVIFGDLALYEGDWITNPTRMPGQLMVARTLVASDGSTVMIRLINCTDREVALEAGTPICDLEEVPAMPAMAEELDSVEEDPVQRLLNEVDKEVPAEVKSELATLLKKYRHVFSQGPLDMGRTDVVQHEIDTGDNKPVRQALRPQPLAMLPMIDEQLDEMLKLKIISPSYSEWASNVVMVKKKDGSLRFCIDYRKLNEKTVKDVYPLPRIDSCLDALAGARWFSTFDLRAGYHQVGLHPRDAHKTTFITRRGSFQFDVLPFGLCNAPATFERLMDLVMSGLNYESLLVYLDDIIVFSETLEVHLVRLELVFLRLEAAGLKLKASKCHIMRQKVLFLGHVVTPQGISTDPEKITLVTDWPPPRNLKEVRSFVGLCSYYRRYVKDFARVAEPLHALTRKNVRFEWSAACADAFDKLKICLTTAPILTLPTDEDQYLLDTDASDVGLGAVLSIVTKDGEKPVAYGSRLCNKPERNYNVTRRELLAVMFGLKTFRQYLLGRRFTIRTDHAALQWLKKTPTPIGQQARWVEQLEEFDYIIQHRPGTKHGNADAMSRRPQQATEPILVRENAEPVSDENDAGESEMNVNAVRVNEPRPDGAAGEETPPPIQTEDMSRQQREDSELGDILRLRSTREIKPSPAELIACGASTKAYAQQWDQLRVERGVLFRHWIGPVEGCNRQQVVLPQCRRQDVIRAAHAGFSGGHFGLKKTLAQVQRRAYWVGWTSDVRLFCLRCPECAKYHRGAAPKQGALTEFRVGEPMERWGIDLTGPHPTSAGGHKYILTAIDYFSRWTEAFPVRNQEATTVAKILVEQVFVRFGVPLQILSDQGPNFESGLFQEMCRLLGIDKVRTSPYQPRTNGMIERWHRTLNSMLGKVVGENQRDWHERLPYVMAAYRATEHSRTGFSPNYLFVGREARAPVDLTLTTEVIDDQSPAEYVVRQRRRIQEAYEYVREFSGKMAMQQKRRYDLRVKPKKFERGDWVWYLYPRRRVGKSPKWASLYTGPYLVVRVLGSLTYQIQKSRRANMQVVHVDKLKRVLGEVPKSWLDTDDDGLGPLDSNELPETSWLHLEAEDSQNLRGVESSQPNTQGFDEGETTREPVSDEARGWEVTSAPVDPVPLAVIEPEATASGDLTSRPKRAMKKPKKYNDFVCFFVRRRPLCRKVPRPKASCRPVQPSSGSPTSTRV